MQSTSSLALTAIGSFIAGALTFGYLGYAIAWSNPPASPPNSNVSAPLNIGASSQSKSGALSIVNLLDVNSLSVWGDTILSGTNNYLNFGTVPGSSGYGIRNNAGTMEFKNTGGVWASLNSVIQSYLSAGAVTQVKFVDGTTQTTAAGAETDPQVGSLTASRYCKADSTGSNVVCSTTACGDVPNGAVQNVSICRSACDNSVNGVNVTRCVSGSLVSSGCPVGGRCSCFTKDALVAMADGTMKEIHNVIVGDRVVGDKGINTVIGLDHTLLWKGKPQHLISINGGQAFMTDNHPVMTTEGWKALNPGLAEKEAYDVLSGSVGQLEIGNEIVTSNGTITVGSITQEPQPETPTRLYNLQLDGNHTFYSNGMLVHGVVPDKEGRFKLDNQHEGE